MLLKATKTLAQQADPIKLQRSQPGGIAVALWLLQSTCPCILRYEQVHLPLPFILAEQIIIMVNREIKGTIAKLKERNSIPLRIVTADGSVHLFGIFSEILQT